MPEYPAVSCGLPCPCFCRKVSDAVCPVRGIIVVSRSMPRYPGGFWVVSELVVSRAAAASLGDVSLVRALFPAHARPPISAAIAA
jgi:hypothetical protein